MTLYNVKVFSSPDVPVATNVKTGQKTTLREMRQFVNEKVLCNVKRTNFYHPFVLQNQYLPCFWSVQIPVHLKMKHFYL